ncbi:MAG TPA: PQQ-dependent sugar dehydrogenase, partial [Nitrososphaeraceae archaeon]|nr:PQQ-dependent sugar dehydrogenase [Nitrososphaeraceae archaeon]
MFSCAILLLVRVTVFSLIIIVVSILAPAEFTYAQEEMEEEVNTSVGGDEEEPSIKDPNLEVQLVSSDGGLELPTSMAFLGDNDILVLEKDKGTVQRIVNGKILPEPLLDVNVATQSERGMLGIAVAAANKSPNALTYVFLYYTEAQSKDGEDLSEKKDPLGNRLYRYELVNDKLINPKLLLDLPATPGPSHNGGVVTIGP